MMEFLNNTDIVVSIAFAAFVCILLYLKVPGIVAGLLDKRADAIRTEIDEARALREEAQTLLASFERKQKEVAEQAEGIISAAKTEAGLAFDAAKEELVSSIARRIQAATEQIGSAEQAAVREVRDRAIAVATAAAGDVIAKSMTATLANKLIEDSIADAGAKLH